MSGVYQGYLKSDHWKKVKKSFNKTEVLMCWVCGTKRNIQVHHLNYETIGRESGEELIPLCAFHHRGLHFFTGKHEAKKPIESLKHYILYLKEMKKRKKQSEKQLRINRICRERFLLEEVNQLDSTYFS